MNTLSAKYRLLPMSWLLVVVAAAAVAQEPAVDANLPAQIKQLRTFVKNPKMEDDLRALDAIELMVAAPDKRNPRDLDRIADAIGEVFELGKLRSPEHTRLYEHAAKALATLGTRGAKPLRAAIEHARFKDRDYARLRARLVEALGETKDEAQAEFLLDLALRSPDNPVLAAAGQALGNFTALPTAKLRDVVKRLVSRYGEWTMQASAMESSDPNAPIDLAPQNARETLVHVRTKWNTALGQLTGQSFQDAAEWQRWLNKNKDWLPPGRKS